MTITTARKLLEKEKEIIFFYFYCYTQDDINTGAQPSRVQQISSGDGYNNIKKFCELSIPTDEIISLIKNDECIVQQVEQPYDMDWYNNCIESQFHCGNNYFPMRWGNAYSIKFNQLTGDDEFNKYFNVFVKRQIASIYYSKNQNCQEIDRLGQQAFFDAFKSYNFCERINDYQRYPGFFTAFAEIHNLSDPYIQKLLSRLLAESKNCGDKTYSLLKRLGISK